MDGLARLKSLSFYNKDFKQTPARFSFKKPTGRPLQKHLILQWKYGRYFYCKLLLIEDYKKDLLQKNKDMCQCRGPDQKKSFFLLKGKNQIFLWNNKISLNRKPEGSSQEDQKVFFFYGRLEGFIIRRSENFRYRKPEDIFDLSEEQRNESRFPEEKGVFLAEKNVFFDRKKGSPSREEEVIQPEEYNVLLQRNRSSSSRGEEYLLQGRRRSSSSR